MAESEDAADGDDSVKKRPQFGNRQLTSENEVFKHNAWDNVEWTDDQEQQALEIVQKQSLNKMTEEEGEKIMSDASGKWNNFYETHDAKFFKDRHWLFTEFPELFPGALENVCHRYGFHLTDSDTESSYPGEHADTRFFEIGCGAGNTVFPVLRTNDDANFFMYACDYSISAINIVKSNPKYDKKRCHVFVHDIASTDSYPMPDESLDIIIMIFVLSALPKDKMVDAVTRLAKLLKPGGVIVLRDYGRFDMAQLRFKSNRCIEENFYCRGDGTLVYFFTTEELRSIFLQAGLVEEQNMVDRRLQVNRAKQVKMYRVWNQAKFRKPKDIRET